MTMTMMIMMLMISNRWVYNEAKYPTPQVRGKKLIAESREGVAEW